MDTDDIGPQSDRRSMNVRSWISILLGLLWLGCSSAPKAYQPVPTDRRPENPPTAAPVNTSTKDAEGTPLLAQPLTAEGDNFRPIYSPDGKRILFISESREAHKNAQLYELDLTTRAERRITFHDGDVLAASYFPDGRRVLYSSTTDEIKEDPAYIRNLREKYERDAKAASTAANGSSAPPTAPAATGAGARVPGTLELQEKTGCEIYESRLDGSDIRRLTKSAGFDSYPSMARNGRFFVFSSDRGGQRDLYAMNMNGGGLRKISSNRAREIDPTLSPDSWEVAWSKLSDDFASAQIFIAEGRRLTAAPLTAKAAMQVAPAWNPNGKELIFSSNRGDGKSFDLYALDRKATCLKRLTESPNDELFPTFSPDGKQIIFSSNHSGRWLLYVMDYQPPGSCLTETP